MSNEIDNLKRVANEVKLGSADKAAMKAKLSAHMSANPLPPGAQSAISTGSILGSSGLVSGLIGVVLVAGLILVATTTDRPLADPIPNEDGVVIIIPADQVPAGEDANTDTDVDTDDDPILIPPGAEVPDDFPTDPGLGTGPITDPNQDPDPNQEPPLGTNTAEYFRTRLEAEVSGRFGQPIEGFEAIMFIQTYQGLVPADFEGVEAAGGEYRVDASGNFTFVTSTNADGFILSNYMSISADGYDLLLTNLSKRLGVETNSIQAINDLLEEIN